MRKMVAVMTGLLVLTGCTTEPEQVEQEPVESVQEVTPAPLQAEPEPDPEADSPDVEFLEGVRLHTDRPTIMNATDEQLLEAGKLACEKLATNPALNEIQLIDGEEIDDKGRYWDSMAIAANANSAFCPEIELTLTPSVG